MPVEIGDIPSEGSSVIATFMSCSLFYYRKVQEVMYRVKQHIYIFGYGGRVVLKNRNNPPEVGALIAIFVWFSRFK